MSYPFPRVALLTVFIAASLCLMPARPAEAESIRIGHVLLEYGDPGDNPLQQAVTDGHLPMEYANGYTITRSLNAGEKQQIQHAASYFATLMSSMNPAVTAKIYTGFVSDPDNGSATSYAPGADMRLPDLSPNGSLYDAFMAGAAVPGYPDYLADNIIIFQIDYPHTPTRLLLADNSVMASMMHELGHAFGIMVGYDVNNADNTKGVFTPEKFTEWDAHLYDVFGKQAERGMYISMDVTNGTPNNTGVFQIYANSALPGDIADYKYPTFRGPQVDELTGGLGMPVMGGFSNEGSGLDGANALGHPGIMQSIMSYGIIRNMPFTEMELAAFEDMGYTIDRSQFFGKSYYYEVGGNDQVNTRGFGTADAPNTTLFGLGTHIMRDNLTLSQQADIYASGYGGGGMRIDGVGNALTIPGGVTVAADGAMGTGLLVSYGSGNTITLDGTLRATGEGGIGAHFGVMADNKDIYSYMDLPTFDKETIQQRHEYQRAVQDMNGPLVRVFSISDTLAGRKAAISIENDVHVEAINLLPGARIEGDIVSRWSNAGFAYDKSGASAGKFTDITVGSVGAATGQMYIAGNILGNNDATNSLNIIQEAGTLHFNGQADVGAWNIEPHATLGGNSTITLHGSAPLSNKGTITPGNSIGTITIVGDFTNAGTLGMEFDGKGATDKLSVTGNFQHSSGGKVSVSPVRDYYNGSMTISTPGMFAGGPGSSLPDTITDFISPDSPTLSMSMTSGAGTYTINTFRSADAYSRYASSGNAARVGGVLQGVAGVAQGDMQNLLGELDFSAPDGSGVGAALPQLTASPYARAAQASAEATLSLGRMALAQLRTAAGGQSSPTGTPESAGLSGGDSAAQWSAFVMPFGGGSLQQQHAGAPGYNSSQVGLMGGAYRQTDHMNLSLYSAFSRRQVDMWTEAGAQARGSALHVGAAALWSEDSEGKGSGWQIWGQAQLGVENTDMRRSVAFENYARQNDSFYTSFNGMAQIGGGYLWRVDAFSFGPRVGLEYAINALPAVEEDSGGGSRLGMDAHTWHDLRGVAGLMATWRKDMGEGRFVRASLESVWRQDLLPEQRTVRAYFADYAQYPFDSRVEREGGGSLGLTGGIEVSLRQDVVLSAQVEADVLRPGYSSVGGGLSLRWEF